MVDVAGETDFVGDEQLFFLGVTKKSRTNVNTSSIFIECTINTIDSISANHTCLIVWHCPRCCFLHCHGGNRRQYHSQRWRNISCIVDTNTATNNTSGESPWIPPSMTTTGEVNIIIGAYHQKKILTLFLFHHSGGFWGPAWFCHAVAFFCGGWCLFTLKKIQRFGVTMVHAQKHLKIQRSKNKANSHEDLAILRQKYPKIQRES